MEMTTLNTPKLKGVVERSFATELNYIRAMFYQAKFTPAMISNLWGMAVLHLEKTKNMSSTSANEKDLSPNQLYDKNEDLDTDIICHFKISNKKTLEALALAGGYDSFTGTHRAMFFHDEGGTTFLEKAIKYAHKHQENENSAQVSLFGEASDVQIAEPEVPPCEEWGTMEKLSKEREVVGVYISGHPLDDFKTEMKTFCNGTVGMFNTLEPYVNRELVFGGVVTDVQHRVSKQGKGWALFTIEDYTDSFEFRIFGEEYLKFRHFLLQNSFVFVKSFIREGWTNKDTGKKSDPRLQFNSFQLLHDVMENYAKKLSIQVDIKDLDKQKIMALKELLNMHPGNQALNFLVYDMKEKIKLSMSSRRQKVRVSQELISELEAQDVQFKLN